MWFWTFLLELQPPILLSFWVCHKERGSKEADMNQLEKGWSLGLLIQALIQLTVVLLTIHLNIHIQFRHIFLASVRLPGISHLVHAIGSLLEPAILQHLL